MLSSSSRNSWLLFLWGLLAFASLPVIHYAIRDYYAKKETLYSCPVPVQNNRAVIRNDSHGKGFFGASRNGGRTHQGIDILGKLGDPVYAPKSGRVLRVENSPKGYGQMIEIKHPDGLTTLYAHLSKISIKNHDWVPRGFLIGNTGKTGNASSPNILPHLHFELRYKDKAINPNQLISFILG